MRICGPLRTDSSCLPSKCFFKSPCKGTLVSECAFPRHDNCNVRFFTRPSGQTPPVHRPALFENTGTQQKSRVAAALLQLFRFRRNGDSTLSVQGARVYLFSHGNPGFIDSMPRTLRITCWSSRRFLPPAGTGDRVRVSSPGTLLSWTANLAAYSCEASAERSDPHAILPGPGAPGRMKVGTGP